MTPNLTPWYDLPEAAQLLLLCGMSEPDTVRHFQTFTRTRDEWTTYDRADERVARLDEIRVAHLDPLLRDRVNYREWSIAAGLMVEVDAAIEMAVEHRKALLKSRGRIAVPADILAADRMAVKLGIGTVHVMAMQKMGRAAA